MNVQICEGPEEAAAAAAEVVLAEMRARRGKVLLAGGDVWRRAYQLLGQLATPADYKSAHLFVGDERCVPPDHIESLYGMMKRAWFDPARVPPERVHRIMGELEPERAARLAEDEVRSVAGPRATLDVATVGLMPDGRAGSLTPGSAALEDTERLFVPSENLRRVSATLALINACSRIVFIATGSLRAQAVHDALCEPPGSVPASLVGTPEAPPTWILDRDAAALL